MCIVSAALQSSHRLGDATHYRRLTYKHQVALFPTLEDLDFADVTVLLSHTHNYMQEKTSRLSTYPHHVRLSISLKKSEVTALNI